MIPDELAALVTACAPQVEAPTVAYSVLFGSYDRPPRIRAEAGIDFVLFTDRPETVPSPWRVIFVDPSPFGAQRTGRYLKCLGHLLFPSAARSVYLDASFRLLRPLRTLLDDYGGGRFHLFAHAERQDIAQEAAACIRQGKDRADLLNDQVARYRAQGLPTPSGCYSTGVLLRDLTDPAVMSVNEDWCAEIATASLRDQISLPYALWQRGVRPGIVPGDIFFNPYLVPRPHVGAPLSTRAKRWAALTLYQSGLYR